MGRVVLCRLTRADPVPELRKHTGSTPVLFFDRDSRPARSSLPLLSLEVGRDVPHGPKPARPGCDLSRVFLPWANRAASVDAAPRRCHRAESYPKATGSKGNLRVIEPVGLGVQRLLKLGQTYGRALNTSMR